MAILMYTMASAQVNDPGQAMASGLDENAFTFTEAQLGEDDDMSANVTILNSTNNVYASEVGYLFSPVRFRYRGFNQKYNNVFTGTSGGGVQLRITNIVVTYAK